MVARRYGSNAFAHLLDHPAAFVTQDTGKQTFRVFSRQGEDIGVTQTGRHDPDENLSFLGAFKVDFLDLQPYREQYIANLPYGVRKVVELARALCTEPKLLLLDEPDSGLSVEETENVAFWIDDIKNDLGIAILMVEHDMSLVTEVSDRVMAMNDGRTIAEGTSDEVQNHPDVLRAYLGA